MDTTFILIVLISVFAIALEFFIFRHWRRSQISKNKDPRHRNRKQIVENMKIIGAHLMESKDFINWAKRIGFRTVQSNYWKVTVGSMSFVVPREKVKVFRVIHDYKGVRAQRHEPSLIGWEPYLHDYERIKWHNNLGFRVVADWGNKYFEARRMSKLKTSDLTTHQEPTFSKKRMRRSSANFEWPESFLAFMPGE